MYYLLWVGRGDRRGAWWLLLSGLQNDSLKTFSYDYGGNISCLICLNNWC